MICGRCHHPSSFDSRKTRDKPTTSGHVAFRAQICDNKTPVLCSSPYLWGLSVDSICRSISTAVNRTFQQKL